MEGKTHRVGGVLGAVAGFLILQHKNMLIPEVNPILQLSLMYPFSIYGSVFSDLDHNWDSSPAKDPISWAVNKVLHLTSEISGTKKDYPSIVGAFSAKHRSWQTHSEIFFALLIALNWYLFTLPSDVNMILLRLMVMGFTIGVVSHLILDMLTPAGIWCMSLSMILRKKIMIKLVPKSSFFVTGGPWERLVRSLMWVVIIFLFILIAYQMCPYELQFNF